MNHEIRSPIPRGRGKAKGKSINRSTANFLKNARKAGYSIESCATGFWCFNPPRFF